jgi:hypothetical protein
VNTTQQPPHGSREHRRLTAEDRTDDGSWHPAWCEPRHCYVTDDGVRVHQTALACYEDGLSRFELQLLCPEDEFVTYLQLLLKDLCLGRSVCAFAPLATVTWLRDQLAEHLDATVRSNGEREGVLTADSSIARAPQPAESG